MNRDNKPPKIFPTDRGQSKCTLSDGRAIWSSKVMRMPDEEDLSFSLPEDVYEDLRGKWRSTGSVTSIRVSGPASTVIDRYDARVERHSGYELDPVITTPAQEIKLLISTNDVPFASEEIRRFVTALVDPSSPRTLKICLCGPESEISLFQAGRRWLEELFRKLMSYRKVGDTRNDATLVLVNVFHADITE